MSADGYLPAGTTYADIDRRFGGADDEFGCECGSPRAVPGYDCPTCGEYVMDEADLEEAAREAAEDAAFEDARLGL